MPYRGAGPAIQDLVAGQIDLGLPRSDVEPALCEGGQDEGLRRVGRAALADVAGYADHDRIRRARPEHLVLAWIVDDQGHAANVVARLDNAVQTALADPDVRKRLETLGQIIFPSEQQNPAALAAYNKAEIDKWWPIIKAAEIKTE